MWYDDFGEIKKGGEMGIGVSNPHDLLFKKIEYKLKIEDLKKLNRERVELAMGLAHELFNDGIKQGKIVGETTGKLKGKIEVLAEIKYNKIPKVLLTKVNKINDIKVLKLIFKKLKENSSEEEIKKILQMETK